MRVKCLAQEHNIMSPSRARTWTACSGVERTNHQATAPPILPIVVHSFTPSGRFFNHLATVSGVGLSLAGVENFVTSASCFLAVPMELVANHGSATVSLNGEDYFVIKVTRALDS